MNAETHETTAPVQHAKPHRRRAFRAAIIVLAVIGVTLGIKYTRHHVFPKRFAVVEEGELYRSGYLETWPLERVIEKHQLRTVLTLMNDEPGTPRQENERATLRAADVELVRIGMPGDGRGAFDDLDAAAAVIADERRRPLLVHCAAGVHRTTAAYAAWRMKYCGWDIGQALEEAARYGITPQSKPELCDHLRRYYEERVQAGDVPETPPASTTTADPSGRP